MKRFFFRKHRRLRLYAGRALLVCGSLAIGLLIIEYSLRLGHRDETFGVTHEVTWLRNADQRWGMTAAPGVGYRPVFDDKVYNHYGTRVNEYALNDRKNRKRLLFLGDSVMARGLVIEALRGLYGEKDYEYWNAGVESYNTEQELNYYLAYNQPIKPDHVILEFHLNDFEITPFVFRNEAGEMEIHSAQTHIQGGSEWLFRNSYIYREWMGRRILQGAHGRSEIIATTRECLRRLQEVLSRDGIQFTIIIQPVMSAPDGWWNQDREAHTLILSMVHELGIRHFDLIQPLRQALADGVNVSGTPPDTWHPDRLMAGYFARYLKRQGLLEDSAGRQISQKHADNPVSQRTSQAIGDKPRKHE